MYASAFPLLFVFQLCSFLVQMSFYDCKSKCGIFKSIENLENTEEHKAKEINVASRIPGDARFLCFIVFC